jgi:dihydrofolate reductase
MVSADIWAKLRNSVVDRCGGRADAHTSHLLLSTTLTDTSWPTARIVRDIDEIGALKHQPGQAVYVFGGPGLVANLVNDDLLDELHLIVHPASSPKASRLSSGGSPSARHSTWSQPGPRHPAA